MTSPVETAPLLEGELPIIEEAVGYLKGTGINYTIGIANDGVPDS